jgi:hypothetical protein
MHAGSTLDMSCSVDASRVRCIRIGNSSGDKLQAAKPRERSAYMARGSGDNIYGDVNSGTDIRDINRQIRSEMRDVSQRGDLTELKKRADYLCTLALAPSWQTKFGRRADSILATAKAEDRKTTERANEIARKHGWDADYDPWGD